MRKLSSVQVDDERTRPDHLLFSSTLNATLLSLDLLEGTRTARYSETNWIPNMLALAWVAGLGRTSMW